MDYDLLGAEAREKHDGEMALWRARRDEKNDYRGSRMSLCQKLIEYHMAINSGNMSWKLWIENHLIWLLKRYRKK